MLLSGEWAGSMQRTVEDLMGGGVICRYANGAEGDVSPQGRSGASNYEQAWTQPNQRFPDANVGNADFLEPFSHDIPDGRRRVRFVKLCVSAGESPPSPGR